MGGFAQAPPLGRAYKQPRRNQASAGRGGHMDDGLAGVGFGMPALGMSPGGGQAAPFDPKQAMEAMMRFQALGIPMPNLPDFGAPFGRMQPSHPGRRRQRCRDYDTKGYCLRGPACPYDHISEPLFMPGGMPPQAEGQSLLHSCFSAPLIDWTVELTTYRV